MDPGGLTIAVVTGGNKGIGLEVCRQLAASGITVVLTARDETRGAAAVEKLREQGISDVIFHQLEVTDASSIARLAEFLKTRFGRLDILVHFTSNSLYPSLSVVALTKRKTHSTHVTAEEGLRTNYYGTKHVTEALLPLLQSSSDGRIVNVSSGFGLLKYFRGEELKQELNDTDNLTEERLDELLDTFLKDFEAGALDFASYKVAKAALNAYSRIMARRHPTLRINCAHPGYVKTDMTRNSGLLTPEEGASNVVKVALLPAGGPTGAFLAMGKEASFL
ncbi:hypothetical protein HU200_031500 [Digitaria exilis]|uniref:Uncharacterized protein n=1 Tax=Digitaria exilis TaxID=1010633 RepID=A0A835ER39_9POAL|nr:hypothetical protein HU200_031500 [Digitaria exilis]